MFSLDVAQYIIDRDYKGYTVIKGYFDDSLGVITHCRKVNNKDENILGNILKSLPSNKKLITLSGTSDIKIFRIALSDYKMSLREMRIKQILNAS